MRNLYSSIDIGSDTIKVLVAEMYKGNLNVLAHSESPADGIKRGLIFDADKTLMSIKKAINDVELKLGFVINKIIATVPSYNADFQIVTGDMMITGEDNEITGTDVFEVLKKVSTQNLSQTRELITIKPIEYAVDDELNIFDPIGLIGSRLAVRAVMVTTPRKNVFSVVSILEQLNIKVIDVSLGMIGDYEEFRNNITENGVGAIINIGGSTTNISLFNKGILIKNSVLQLGGRNIDNDLAYIYKLNRQICKTMKEEFVVANKRLVQSGYTYKVNNVHDTDVEINQLEASEIAISRIDEILYLAKEEIKYLTNKKISYIIVTGGTTEIPGFENSLKTLFGNKAFVGDMKTMGIRENKYAAVSGIIRSFYEKIELRNATYSMFSNEDEEKITTIDFKNANQNKESVISRVFGYFTDN